MLPLGTNSTSMSILLLSLLLLFIVLYQNVKAQKILENLSCDFNDDTLCDWSFNGDVHFEGNFNCSSCDYDNEQGLYHFFYVLLAIS